MNDDIECKCVDAQLLLPLPLLLKANSDNNQYFISISLDGSVAKMKQRNSNRARKLGLMCNGSAEYCFAIFFEVLYYIKFVKQSYFNLKKIYFMEFFKIFNHYMRDKYGS